MDRGSLAGRLAKAKARIVKSATEIADAFGVDVELGQSTARDPEVRAMFLAEDLASFLEQVAICSKPVEKPKAKKAVDVKAKPIKAIDKDKM